MQTVTSQDGTKIAFDKVGSSPAATRSQVKPTWLTPTCSPRSSSNSFSNNTREAGGIDSKARFLPPPSHYLKRRCSKQIN